MHYTVAVITDDGSEATIDELLAPFDENIEVEPYIYKTKEQIIKEFRESVENMKKDMEAYANGTYDTERYRTYWLNEGEESLTDYTKERLELYEKTDEEIYQWYRDGDDDDRYDENGNELSTYNPKSKWDWYTIGGRWDGYFKLKEDPTKTVNSARLDEIQWEGTKEELDAAARYWDIVVEGAEQTEEEKENRFGLSFYKKEYYTDRYESRDDYILRSTRTCPYAVVTPDGNWNAPGEMHWFSSSETAEDQRKYEDWFIQYVKDHPDYYITLVDCHI